MTDAVPEVDLPDISYRARGLILLRGFLGRCPHCGKGKILHRYLKVVPNCTSCGEAYGHIAADDMPPWMTIIIVGHLIVPNMWSFQRTYDVPTWVEQIMWPSLAIVLSAILLPRCKGFCVALLWMLPRLPPAKPRET